MYVKPYKQEITLQTQIVFFTVLLLKKCQVLKALENEKSENKIPNFWKIKYPWVPKGADEKKDYLLAHNICKCEFDISNQRMVSLKKHAETKTHKSLVEVQSSGTY